MKVVQPLTKRPSPRASSGTSIPSISGGVKLGKVLAQRIIPELESKTEPDLAHDSSTNNMIQRYRRLKEIS